MISTLRPSLHFTAPRHWINDPNGLVHFDGEWHLFYQFNPHGIDWGHMSWGHAVSRDLAHWEHLPVALPEQPGYMIFSGSAAVDWRNSAGFGNGGAPPLVAAYTAHGEAEQAQHLAYSLDRGRTWREASGNPVIAIGEKDFRDPKLVWHAPTQRWVMAVALPRQQRVRFYSSPDLRTWTHASDFGPAGATDGVWECPDFFKAFVDGDASREKWVLKVDNGPGIGGHSGGQVFVGSFDGQRFTCDDPADRVRPIDFGADCYAVQSWNDAPDGRHVWLGWMSHWAYAGKTPTAPWRGAMTLPREVSLRTFDEGIHLVQEPVAELLTVRGKHWRLADASIDDANAWLRASGVAGTALEIVVDLALARGASAGLKVRVGAAEETIVGVDALPRQVYIDRSRAGDQGFSPRFEDRHTAALPAESLGATLRVFVDACSVEVFAAGGRVVLTDLIFPRAESDGVALFGEGRVVSLDVWALA